MTQERAPVEWAVAETYRRGQVITTPGESARGLRASTAARSDEPCRLVLEDAPLLLLAPRPALARFDFTAATGSRGAETLGLLPHGSCDALVSDLNVPAVDGTELCERFEPFVLKWAPRTEHLVRAREAQRPSMSWMSLDYQWDRRDRGHVEVQDRGTCLLLPRTW